MSLTGKVVLITGGSKGIGKATALKAAQQGATVVISYSSDQAAADDVVAQIGADRTLAVKGNAGRLDDLQQLVDATVQRFGKIDVLIANAATATMRDLASTSEADFDASFSLNVKGPYFLVQKAAPHMPPGSKVILVSTGLAKASHVAPHYLLYVSTKGAIEQMTRILAKDLAQKSISVNAVAPGPTATELFYNGKSDEVVDHIKSMSPFNRIGVPDDVADVFVFLAGGSSLSSAWISGQVVHVNGAMA